LWARDHIAVEMGNTGRQAKVTLPDGARGTKTKAALASSLAVWTEPCSLSTLPGIKYTMAPLTAPPSTPSIFEQPQTTQPRVSLE
jgi:hypothetical protein